MQMTKTSFAETLASAKPASLTTGAIFVGRLASGSPVELPYIIAKGAKPGKCLWINGQVHGDEINGIVAALDFARGLDLSTLSGSVVVSSTANPLAFDGRAKKAPQDDIDLDQSFPGSANGLSSERMAKVFFEASAAADVLVNLHTMGTPMDAEPYAVYKRHPSGRVSESELLRLIAPFMPAVACRMSIAGGTGELPGNLAGALDYQCLDRGQIAFMIELGGGGRLEKAHVAQGIAGFKGLAQHLSLLPEAPRVPPKLRQVTKRRHVTCTEGGIFRALAKPTEIVPAGQALGEIIDLHGATRERITLAFDALIIGIRRDPVVHFGDRVGFVAEAWTDVAI
jgi:predicted deacylase